ncbi:hypothetical protein HY485_05480 [Candidatus Woesearchaeota archaeon]|nr:hypothetical protein [Candidatus Woesearchaeota archaeon]
MPDEDFPPFGGPPVGFETHPGKTKVAEPAAVDKSVVDQMNTVLTRLRDAERRFGDVQELMRFHEEESRKNINRLWTKVKESDGRITELSHQLAELEKQLHLVINEIRLTAKKEDFEVMKRFVEYIKPVKFVTVDQVERIVNDILEEHGAIKEKAIEE